MEFDYMARHPRKFRNFLRVGCVGLMQYNAKCKKRFNDF